MIDEKHRKQCFASVALFEPLTAEVFGEACAHLYRTLSDMGADLDTIIIRPRMRFGEGHYALHAKCEVKEGEQ